MRDVLSNVLGGHDEDSGVDQILAAAFFRKRPLQAGSSASLPRSSRSDVVVLADRRAGREKSETGFLGGARGVAPKLEDNGDERSEELPKHGGVRA